MNKLLHISNDTRPLLDVRRWGPCGWIFITACAFTYPKKASIEEQTHMLHFLDGVAHVMPCKMCRTHFQEALETVALEGKMELLKWVCETRNNVNKRTGKKSIAFDDMYRECVTGCKNTAFFRCTWKKLSIVLFILLVFFISKDCIKK